MAKVCSLRFSTKSVNYFDMHEVIILLGGPVNFGSLGYLLFFSIAVMNAETK